MMNAHAPIVLIEHLHHAYNGMPILTDINLAVQAGEFVTVVGASGCGKSTLLRLVVGAESIQMGTIRVGESFKTKPDSHCGIVYQRYSVFPHLTVFDNILFGLRMRDVASTTHALSTDIHKVEGYLRYMGLVDARDKYPYQLSGGMQQRVAIAQALIREPTALLLDEPFSALDSWRREQLQSFLLNIYQQTRMTVIFVTHDLQEAVLLGTRVIVLSSVSNQSTKERGATIQLDVSIAQRYPRDESFKHSSSFHQYIQQIKEATAQPW